MLLDDLEYGSSNIGTVDARVLFSPFVGGFGLLIIAPTSPTLIYKTS